MMLDGILPKIGFTKEMQKEYYRYKDIAPTETEELAFLYMNDKIAIEEAEEKIIDLETDEIHRYTIQLVFLLECTGFLYDEYTKRGISKEIFYDTVKDITYKLKECIDTYDIFGIFAFTWFDGFFKMTRFAFGRLQFDLDEHKEASVKIANYTMEEGDFVVKCHIPSSGPLLHKECIEAYKAVYDYVKPKTKILPIECHSWLLFPNYKDFFSDGSNTAEFIKDYVIYDVYKTNEFCDGWRIFGKEAESDNLPRKTSMQRKFADYITPGKEYGCGLGIFLFDGENIIK